MSLIRSIESKWNQNIKNKNKKGREGGEKENQHGYGLTLPVYKVAEGRYTEAGVTNGAGL